MNILSYKYNHSLLCHLPPTDIQLVTPAKPLTPVRAETSVIQPKAATLVNTVSQIKPSVVKQTGSY